MKSYDSTQKSMKDESSLNNIIPVLMFCIVNNLGLSLLMSFSSKGIKRSDRT